MNRASAFALSVLVACGGPSGASRTTPPDEPQANDIDTTPVAEQREPLHAPDLVIGEDVSALFQGAQSDDYRGPANTFRTIPITPMEPPAVTRDEHGFRVRLPSGAPIVTPTLHRGAVLVSGGFRSRQLFAYRPQTGEPLWGLSLGDDGPSNPACERGICVFNTESCTIFAVDAETGELKWSWYLGDPLMSAPTIADGRVYTSYPARHDGHTNFRNQAAATTPDGRPLPENMTHALGAFDLETGELLWTRWIDAEVMSAPVAIMDKVYITTFGGTMIRFDAETGAVEQARRANATSAPSYIEGALYFARRDAEPSADDAAVRTGEPAPAEQTVQRLMRTYKPGGGDAPAAASAPRQAEYLEESFQAATRRRASAIQHDAANGFANGAPSAANAQAAQRLIGRTSVQGLQEYQGSWVLQVGGLNVASMGDSLVAFDRQSGEERWANVLPGDIRQLGNLGAPPILAGTHIVSVTPAGVMMVMNSTSGEVSQRVEINSAMRTQPIAHEGWVYLGTGDGQLIARDLGDRSITGWPTWAGNAQRTGQPLSGETLAEATRALEGARARREAAREARPDTPAARPPRHPAASNIGQLAH